MLTPVTIWITGLSVSGKTTLGERLERELLSLGIENVVLLDGEVIRERLKNFKYASNDRNYIAFKKAELALEHNKEGKIVIVTGITHQREIRAKLREYLGRFMEVYLKCPVEVCAQRDYKGNYQKAYAGELENFVGVTVPYEESNPELVLDTDKESVEECSRILVRHALDFINSHNPNE